MKSIVSSNANIFKPLAIFCIAFGHFLGSSKTDFYFFNYWWNLDTISLLYFSTCSAYFTDIKYFNNFICKEFWKNKIGRLGVKLIVINLFLLLVFVLRSNDNVFSFYSVVNMIGMGGLLNWLHIKNISPFGAGTWFLTVLLFFYALYPVLRRLCLTEYRVYLISIIVATLLILDRYYSFGYMLWLTICGYFVGLYFSREEYLLRIINIKRILFCVIFVLILFLTLNFFNIKFLNGLFLLMLGSLLFLLTFLYDFSCTFLKYFKYFNFAVFEIYMIHQYFFILRYNNLFVNLFLSAVIFLSISLALAYLSRWVMNQLRKLEKFPEKIASRSV